MQNPIFRSVIIVLVVASLGVIGYYLLTQYKGNLKTMATPSSRPIVQMESGNQTTTLTSLLKSDKTGVCTNNSDDYFGTFYIHQGKVKADFLPLKEGLSLNMHIITGVGSTYSWSGDVSGLKLDSDVSQVTSALDQNQNIFDFNKSVKFICDPWQPDTTYFSAPPKISFTNPEPSPVPTIIPTPKN